MFVYNERKAVAWSGVWRKLGGERAQKHWDRACGRGSEGQDVTGVGARSAGGGAFSWLEEGEGGDPLHVAIE